MADLIRTGEAASILGVHRDTVRRWAASGELPAVETVSGYLAFVRADVEEFARWRQGLPKRA